MALKRLGQRLRRVRLERGISEEMLVASAGIPAARLAAIERGCVQVRGSELFDLAEACRVPFDYFISELSTCDADGLPWAGDDARLLGRYDGSGRAMRTVAPQGSSSEAAEDGRGACAPWSGALRQGFGAADIASRDGQMVLTWDAETISHESLSAMKRRIDSARCASRFMLRFNYGGWAEEEFEHREAALARIDQIMEHVADPWPEDIRIDRQPPAEHQTWRVEMLSRLWRQGEGRLDGAGRRRFDELMPRLLIFDELRYQHIGEESLFASVAGAPMAEECLGRRYDFDPAQAAYSRSVCRDYETVLIRNRPSYDHICARVRVGPEFRWLLYQRFMAPFTLSGGRSLLAVLCDPTGSVSIPFLCDEPR